MTAFSPTSETSSNSQLMTLAQWMAGEFTNNEQAYNDPTRFAHIHVFFRPLPFEFFSGIGFYSEQSYDYDIWGPYRQGVHRLVDNGDHIYIENYALENPMLYAGSGHNTEIFATLKPDKITRRVGCSMVFRRDGELFRGEVEPGQACIIPRDGHTTYLVSAVEVTDATWVSIDEGMDINTHEKIWGSAEGPLRFKKKQSFANLIPKIP